VSIATCYRLDGAGIESRWEGEIAPIQTDPGAHPMGTGSFLGVKRLGRSVDHPSPSSAEVKERVGLYLYFRARPSFPVLE